MLRRNNKFLDKEKRISLIKAISSARMIEGKLIMLENRLESSINTRFKELVEAQAANSIYKTTLADEVADRKRLLNSIRTLRLSIERLRVRLETIRDVGFAANLIAGLKDMIADVKRNIVSNIPELGVMLGDLEEYIMDVCEETRIAGLEVNMTGVEYNSDEVKAILREAAEVAAEKEKRTAPLP